MFKLFNSLLKRIALYTILFSVFILFIQKAGVSQKTDTIIHINGDVLTGELKKMVYGVATWKMDGMGTISMEEPKINTIRSDKLFEIKMKNGFIYFGSFDTSNVDRKVYILVTNGKSLVNVEDIVEIYPLRRSFWMRMTGNFSLGANFSKGSDVGTVVFSGNLDYRKRKTYFNLTWDDNNTFQGDSLTSTKADIGLAWQRLLRDKWSAELSIGASQNTELGSKLKTDIRLIGIRDLTYNNWNRFYMGAGLTVTRETPYDDSDVTQDLTGLIQAVWKVFKYSNPKVWVDANVSFLPYFTGDNRYRTILNLNPKISIFSNDFKVGLKFYHTFDSRPPSDASSSSDYGINLELTYVLH